MRNSKYLKVPLILLALVTAGSNAYAESLAQIKVKNPTSTPFEILEKLYDSSSSPANLSDFDEFNTPSSMHCAGAGPAHSFPVEGNIFKRYEYIVKRGEPSRGSLFPGTPDAKQAILLLNPYEDAAYLPYLKALTAVTVMSKTSSDLVVELIKAPVGLDKHSDEIPVKWLLRKNNDMIALKTILRLGKPNESINYTYCWKN
ncbi:MAG: hypothetical protein ACXWQO_13250 [Bdellovibrionota bacterium]